MSLLDAFRQGQDNPLSRLLSPEIALPMAQALMGGGSNMQNIGNAFGAGGQAFAQINAGKKLTAQTNKTLQLLQKNGADDYIAAIDAGLSPTEALKAYLADQKELKAQTSKGVEYGLNPIWGTDDNGEPVLGTMGKDGSFKKVDTQGVKLESGVDKVDLGTQWGLLNKRTGDVVGYMPKDLAGAEEQKALGDARGKAGASAAGDMQAAENAIGLIQEIRNDPYKTRGTGFSSIGNKIPGTGGYDFQNKVDQAKSGAFLTAIAQMRGLGALSNAEGQTATQAVTRMNTATSEEEFNAALDHYEMIVSQGLQRAQQRMGGQGMAQPPQQPAPPSPGGYRILGVE